MSSWLELVVLFVNKAFMANFAHCWVGSRIVTVLKQYDRGLAGTGVQVYVTLAVLF